MSIGYSIKYALKRVLKIIFQNLNPKITTSFFCSFKNCISDLNFGMASF